MRDGVEHKFSDLSRGEERLVLWKLFSPTYTCRQVLDGGWPLSLLVGSLALVHLVLNRAGLASARSCCCYRAGSLGQESLGEEWYSPCLNRAGLHSLEVMCCYRGLVH